jgi:biopolymer transport protein ExbB
MFDMILNGGIMMIPILICSIVTISIAIERYKYFKRHTMLYAIYAIQDAMHNIDLMNTVNRDYESCKWLKEMITSSDCKRKDFVESSAMIYLMGFKNGLGLLKMIVTISPLLGLLGTIFGMISAFSVFDIIGGNANTITGGIGEALVCTAFGLIVAIMALLVYTYYIYRFKKEYVRMEKCIKEVLRWGENCYETYENIKRRTTSNHDNPND